MPWGPPDGEGSSLPGHTGAHAPRISGLRARPPAFWPPGRCPRRHSTCPGPKTSFPTPPIVHPSRRAADSRSPQEGAGAAGGFAGPRVAIATPAGPGTPEQAGHSVTEEGGCRPFAPVHGAADPGAAPQVSWRRWVGWGLGWPPSRLGPAPPPSIGVNLLFRLETTGQSPCLASQGFLFLPVAHVLRPQPALEQNPCSQERVGQRMISYYTDETLSNTQ